MIDKRKAKGEKMKALQALIIETVEERYYKNTDFYLPLGFNSSTWNNFKQGITDINNMKYERVQAMLDTLFSDYEMHLFKKAELHVGDPTRTDWVIELYEIMRKDAIHNLGDDLYIDVKTQTDEQKGFITIFHGVEQFIKLHSKPIHLPEGLKVDRNFILEHIDSLV